MNERQTTMAVLLAIASVITEAVKESGPLGMPGGLLYAGLMIQGCTLYQFDQIMDGLVAAGKLRRDSDSCYHAI